ncbi:MAG: response regulator [Planctomycetia bacterium]|nr:response regulator [Planctomycetia bacterium]
MPGCGPDVPTAVLAPLVLVVDDEPLVREAVSRWLSAAGYACARAAAADEAWACLAQQEVALVVLDIGLSGCSGLELLARVKERHAGTEVIMLTAEAEVRTAIQALSAGAAGYLVKPVEAEELLVQVRRALERRELLSERREYTRKLEQRVREQTDAVRRAHEETIHCLLAASMYRDEETGAHVRRVGECSALIAESLGWPAEQVDCIRLAAPMHDIGKIGIPDAVLQKPGRLTAAEYEIMKRHTVIGAQMLAESDSPILKLASQIALCHHERWDGRGYPRGTAGDAIPEAARIVAVVDVYDALTHDRIYRPALPEGEALSIMESGGGAQFDPALLRLFLALLPEMRRIAEGTPDEPEQENGAGARELVEQRPGGKYGLAPSQQA